MAVGTGVRAEWISYPGDGLSIQGYIARPEGTGTWPGIVMIHENPGLTEHRQEVTRLLAGEGYVVLPPTLFPRIGGKAPAGDDHERHLAIGAATPDEQVFSDLVHGREYLLTQNDVI